MNIDFKQEYDNEFISQEFVGRGEERTIEILKKLFPEAHIGQQSPISRWVLHSDFIKLGEHYKKHKFDITIISRDFDCVIEVNYHHGKIVEDKWRNVYLPLVEKSGVIGVTIDDNECESLFQLRDGEHTNDWQDYIDVINALKMAGVEPQ